MAFFADFNYGEQYEERKGEFNVCYKRFTQLQTVVDKCLVAGENGRSSASPEFINQTISVLDGVMSGMKAARERLSNFGERLRVIYQDTSKWDEGYPSPKELLSAIKTNQIPRLINPVIAEGENLLSALRDVLREAEYPEVR